MLTNLTTALLNQMSALFGPLLGTRGGDGINFLNQLAQQFMSVFGQVSGLWSNRVSRQMATLRSSMLEKEGPEFELIQTSASELSRLTSQLQQLQNRSDKQSDGLVMAETRIKLDSVWRCLKETARPNQVVSATNRDMRPLQQEKLMQMEAETLQLWRLVSQQLATHTNCTESWVACPSVAECLSQASGGKVQSPSVRSPRQVRL